MEFQSFIYYFGAISFAIGIGYIFSRVLDFLENGGKK